MMRKIKQMLALFLTLAMLVSSIPFNAFAVGLGVGEKGNEGSESLLSADTGFQYNVLEDGTVEICGYKGTDTADLTIPEKIDGSFVTQLAQEAFAYNEMLETIVIPSSVTRIGNSAFYHCSALKAIAFEGESIDFGFTVAEGSTALEKVFCLKSCDISAFCALLISDMGEDEAKEIEILEFDDISALRAAYLSYVNDSQVQIGGTLQSFVAVTDDSVTEGDCGENVTWQLDSNGLLTVSGTGAMADCQSQGSPWYAIKDEIVSVSVGEGITYVGSYTFQNCSRLKYLTLPSSLATIGNYAFYECNVIKSLELPSNLEKIGERAFYNCDGITGGLTIPASVSSIGSYAFYDCDGFNGKLVIEENDGMTIGNYAFCDCRGFTGLEIGSGVTSIGSDAFYYCSGMTGDLVIPNSVTSIGSYAFQYCSGFDGTLTLSENLTRINSYTFINCSKITGELVIPDKVTYIDSYAFENMDGITSVVIGENVTGVSAPFYGCDSIKEMTFMGEKVPSGNPFSGVGTSLETVYVPVESYDAYVAAYKSYLPTSARLSIIGAESDFIIDGDVLTAYLGEGGEVVIPDGIKTIGTGAFQNCKTLTKVTFSNSVETIGEYAFSGCNNLTFVKFSTSLTTIGNYAFQNCVAIQSLKFPSRLEKIGNYAFYNCDGITAGLTISAMVTSIGERAFYDCDGITGGLTIPASVSYIGERAFYDCDGFNGKLVIEENDGMTIGNYAFYDCRGFTGLEIGSGVTSIGSSAFYYCSGMTGDLVIPNSVISIGSEAFIYCSGFDGTLTLPENLTKINSYTFYNCSKITGELVIPDKVTYIDSYAFQNMDGITSVVIGEGVTIVYYPFYDCSNIKEMTFMGTKVPSNNPFSGVGTSIENVYVPAESYDAYVAAYKSYLPTSARLSIIGADSDFLIDGDVLTAYLGEGGEVVIPDGVKTIGTGAFQNCSTLTKVTFSNSVETIGEYAFSGCTGLEDIEFGDNLVTIGNYAFQGCTSIESLTLPNSLVTIGNYAFHNCTGLNTINAITIIDDHYYQYVPGYVDWKTAKQLCESRGGHLATITSQLEQQIVESIVTAGGRAAWLGGYFEDNRWQWVSGEDFSYTNWDEGEPSSPTKEMWLGIYANDTESTYSTTGKWNNFVFTSSTIQGYVCEWHNQVQNILPSSLSHIGNYAFGNCTSLRGGLTIPKSVVIIGERAFYNCEGFNGKLVIEDHDDMAIGSRAFYNCRGFTGLEIGNGVTSIGSYAFQYCSGMKGDLDIPDSVITLGSHAFQYCSGFDGTLTLSENLTKINSHTFSGCSKITGELIIPDNVTYIDSYAFQNMNGITSVVIGENVTGVSYPFNGCDSIKEMTFMGEKVPSGNPFSGVGTSLENVYVPAESYDAYVAAYKSYLPTSARLSIIGADSDFLIDGDVLTAYLGEGGEVVIPDGVKTIGTGAFQNCKTLTKVIMPDSVETIGEYAFSGCSRLVAVELSDNLVTIGNYAFYECSSLVSIWGNEVTPVFGLESEWKYITTSNALTDEWTKPEFDDSSWLNGKGGFGDRSGDGAAVGTSWSGDHKWIFLRKHFTVDDISKWIGHTLILNTWYDDTPKIYINGQLIYEDGTRWLDRYTVIVLDQSCFEYLIEGDNVISISINQHDGGRFIDAGLSLVNETNNIPSKLKTIGNYAFYNCDGITCGLTIPASVSYIGERAFYDCDGFNGKLVIEENDGMTIGNYAFYDCRGFTGLEIGNGVTSIGSYAFQYCSGMKGDLDIPDSVITLGSRAFQYCSGFDGTLTLSENITKINTYTFYNCSKITGELVIPDKVTYIDSYAFENMDGITSVVIGENVTGVSAPFNGCDSIKEMTFMGEKVPSGNPFSGATKALKNVYVPSAAFEDYARQYKSDLISVARIGAWDSNEEFLIEDDVLIAYLGNESEVVIPDGIKTIGVSAFQNYDSLTKIEMPNSVIKIDDFAFCYCINLVDIVWSENLTDIGQDAFSHIQTIKELKLPDSVTRIGCHSFRECRGITLLELPESLITIEECAFYNCDGITGGLTIPSSVISIGEQAFYDCDGFNGKLLIEENDGMTIGNYAFYSCGNFTGLEIGNGVTSIGSYAFQYCSGMKGDLDIPDSVITLGSRAFQYCSGFDGTLTLSENITKINTYTFYNCSKITGELVIPDKVTYIDSYAFENMDGITSVVIGENVTGVSAPFYGCDSIKEMTFMGTKVPSGNPFYGVGKALETVYVPAESYDAYVASYSGYVNDTVQFVTDMLRSKVKNFTASQLYSKTAVLTWSAHISDEVIGYIIKRDGVVIADTTELTYADRTLSVGSEYVYTICGYTSDGRTTTETGITVSPVAPAIKDIKTDNSLNKVGMSNGMVYIYVHNYKNLKPFGNESTVGSLYYLNGEERILIGKASLSSSLGSSLTAVYTLDWDITNVNDGDYTVVFVLQDIDGAVAEYSEILTVDRSVPEKIINVIAVSDVNVIYVNWAISSEIDTIYRIYRRTGDSESFKLITQINDRNTLAYTDTKVEKDKIYYYYVVGLNDFGQESEPSDVTAATLNADTEAPVVTKLTPTNGNYLTGTVSVGITSQDNLAVIGSALYYSVDDGETWILLTEYAGGSFTASFDTTKLSDGMIRIKGVAYDAAGNESAPMIYLFYIDNTGPEQVGGLAYESTSVTITLSWSDVADNDISYYRVELKNFDGTYTKVTDVYKTLGANIYNLTPNTNYTYRVVGYDIHGNRGVVSEDITATTRTDTTVPVISRIRPTSGYYSDKISLSITASDEHSIKSILIQTSTDGSTWTDLYTETYSSVAASRTLSYDLFLENYEDGYLFVRAIATDNSGNQSVSDASAPFVQHVIDRTAPQKPQNVTAIGYPGYIEVSWTQGTESDLSKYSVYRATSEDGTYELVKSGIAALNYFDSNAEPGVTYFYKVTVGDLAGNISEYSDIVNASVWVDEENPQIHSIYPATSNKIGVGYKTISVIVSDNDELDSILIEYSKDGNTYSTLKLFSNVKANNKTVSADLDITKFNHGDSVFVRVTAIDRSGNTTVSDSVKYSVDLTAPTVSSATSTFANDAVNVVWIGNGEEDLSGYRIYRKVKGTASYKLIAQKQVAANQTAYVVSDVSVSDEAVTYVYKVEAVDKWGNTAYAETEITLPDRSMPTAIITCESVFEVGVEYYVDASASTDNSKIVSYHIDFGDGTFSTDSKIAHKYTETGKYTIILTVTDDSGNVSRCTKEITVKERKLLGTVKIQVKDENGNVVPNASVYFDLGEESQIIKYTDNRGYVTFTAEVGRHAVGCIIPNNEWLPAKKDIVVTAGVETTVTMTMVHHVLVEGSFDIHRMTFEEIIAAGIDVTAPENQYYVQVTVYLQYKETKIATPILWNPYTNEQQSKPIVVEDRVYIAKAIGGTPRPGGGGSGGGGTGGTGGGYVFSEEVSVILFEIPVEVSSLKEFFNVKLHIINNASSEFSMLDNVISLNVPDGLTIMDTYISEKDAVVKIAEIKGQTTETITWILRGDKVGEYYLSADYSGILSEFNTPIYTQFVATDPIEVFGLSNLKLLVEVPDMLDNATLYYNVALINEGMLDIYLPRVSTDDVLIEIELFDDRGSDLLEKMGLTAKDFSENDSIGKTIDDWVTSLTGDVGVLKGGHAIRKHYMCIDQSSYSEKEYALQEYWYEMKDSYGLEVEIVVKPLSYFKGYLNSEVNSYEKAEQTLNANKNVYDYLMNNQNFTYWAFYSSTGELKNELPSTAETAIWEMMELDFVELITDKESEELITALILDTMELNAETNSDFSIYKNSAKFLKNVIKFLEEDGWDKKIKEKWADVGKHMPRFFNYLEVYTKWEFYESVTGEYRDSEHYFYYHWSQYVKYESLEITITETEFSKFLHQLFSTEGFEIVWDGLKALPGVITDIVKVCEETEMDIALFIAAQSNIENCNLFLDALIACAPSSYKTNNSLIESVGEIYLNVMAPWLGVSAQIINQTYNQVVYGDANQVVDCAIKIKKQINNGDALRSFVDNLFEHTVDEFVADVIGKSVKKAAEYAGIAGAGWFAAVKLGLKLITFIGNNVFNVSERHDIADNIRYISVMTIAIQEAVSRTELAYRKNSTSENAQRFMQLLYYLINIRAIGESQVAQLGVSYEILPVKFPEGYKNPWTSEDLFYRVCEVSGISDVNSWYEWRDVVEDKLSLMRVELFKNPVATEITGLYAPVVTFDYSKGQTAQKFSDEYQYSIDGGSTWQQCDGEAIKINATTYNIELMVQRIDRANTDQVGTGYCTIYGIPSIMGSGIVAVENSFGYLIDNLDNDKLYEVTFSKTQMEYNYGDSLSMQIPAGSYSFLYQTSEEYEYIYIRALADSKSYASYILESAIVPYESEFKVDVSDGKISNLTTSTNAADLKEYCDKLSESVTVSTASGEEADAVGTGYVLTIDGVDYNIVVAADVNGDAKISIADLYAMLSHVNTEEELVGLFFEAGCVSGNEDIDIFDIFSAYTYITTGKFSE